MAPLAPEGEIDVLAERLDNALALLDGRASAPSVLGAVDLDAERSVGVWVAALETVRVRQIGERVPLRFLRIVDASLALVEPGHVAEPGPGGEPRFELTQPPGFGGIWAIEADAPTRVVIERVETREPRFVAVEVEHEVLEWIDADAANSSLPPLLDPDEHVEGRLLLDAALGRELVSLSPVPPTENIRDPALRRGLEAWRMFSAMMALDRRRPHLRPYQLESARKPILDGTRSVRIAGHSEPYRLADQPGRWAVRVNGPGRLDITARSWAARGGTLANARVRIEGGERVLATLDLSDRQALRVLDEEAAIPRTEPLVTAELEPLGELARTALVIPPGRHELTIELVGGPALLSITHFERDDASLAALAGRTPRKRARAAARASSRSKDEAAYWLALLLAEQTLTPISLASDDPRIDAVGQASPLVAATIAGVLASSTRLAALELDSLTERSRAWLAALARDPELDARARGHLRARWLELLRIHDRPDLVERVIEQVPGGADPIAELPVEGLRSLALLLVESSEPGEVERSASLALLARARQDAPADAELRALSLRLWSRATIWSRRQPRPDRGATLPFVPLGRWLVPRRGSTTELAVRERDWTQIVPGHPVPLVATVTGEAGEGERRRLLDVYVRTPAGDPSPVGLRVDERRWWSPQLSPIMRHRVALAPGVHQVELDAPPDTLAWASLPAADEAATLARLEQLWPLSDSRWSLPGPAIPGIVRVELRWPSSQPARATRIVIVEEQGDELERSRTIWFDPRSPDATLVLDPDALPIDGSPPVSLRHDLTFEVSASTTALRFEVEEGLELAASLSLRRSLRPDELALVELDDAEEPLAAGSHPAMRELVAMSLPELEAELVALSRALLAAPLDVDLRARRAALLMVLDELGLARADMSMLDELAREPELRAAALDALELLEGDIAARSDPREIVVELGSSDEPELLEPAIAALVGDEPRALEPWLASLVTLRESDATTALAHLDAELEQLERTGSDPHTLLIGEVARAHHLSADPTRAREAARTWLELQGRRHGPLGRLREPLALTLAALDPLVRHLEDPASDARDAGVAHGLAALLAPRHGHPRVRRLAMLAALRSRWVGVDHSENNAGFERLELPIAEIEPSERERVRDALLVRPWPGDAEQLSPGREGVLAWDGQPGAMHVELWCRRLRADWGQASEGGLADERARVRVRLVDGEATLHEQALELPDASLHTLELAIARSGRVQLEVALSDDPRWLCAWRAQPLDASGQPAAALDPRRRATWWTAERRRPVEFTLLGPTTLLLESRALTTQVGEAGLEVEIERLGQPAERGSFALDTEPELAVITEKRRRFSVAHTTLHTIVLPEAGPHRVTIDSAAGPVLVRARTRRDRGDLPIPAPPPPRTSSGRAGESDLPDMRGPTLAQSIVARDLVPWAPGRIGTFDALIRVGLDELDDADDLSVRFGTATLLGWRRALIEERLWLRVAAQVRTREGGQVAGGGVLSLGAQAPRIALRGRIELDVLAQMHAGRPEASVRVAGFIDRPTWLSRRVMLLPRVHVGYRWQSLTPERASADVHPRVYQQYVHDHPFVLRPELSLRYFPYSDLALLTRAALQPDSNLRSLDHIDLEAGFEGIGRKPQPWVPFWSLRYQASLRFDSFGEPFYVRHGIAPELGLGVWIADLVRASVGVRYQLFASNVTPIRNVVEVWLRLDATMRRRLRDFGPGTVWFRELWAPRAWADEQRQAATTQAPPR